MVEQKKISIDEWLTSEEVEEVVCEEETRALMGFYEDIVKERYPIQDEWLQEWIEPTGNECFDEFYSEVLTDFSEFDDMEDFEKVRKLIAIAKVNVQLLDACQIYFYDGVQCLFKRNAEEFERIIDEFREDFYEKGKDFLFYPFFPHVVKRLEVLENFQIGWLIDVLERYRDYAVTSKMMKLSDKQKQSISEIEAMLRGEKKG